MLKNYKTKDAETERNEAQESSNSYFFPEYQLTVKANSLEEAEEKLKLILKPKEPEKP